MPKQIFQLEGVHVQFGGLIALHDEALSVSAGEIVGLLGHNGAGKSTMVNVATGAVRPQRGSMKVDGVALDLRGDPRAVERSGVKVIHQVPALADELSIADNITLCRPQELRLPSARRRIAAHALGLLGADLDVDRPVNTLEFGERQIVDLARALSTELRVLFLDEPTGALGQREADQLHALLQRLASEGRGIVYVSHRLRDILSVCTRLVVLRGGRVVMDEPAQQFSVAALSEALVPNLKARKKQSSVPQPNQNERSPRVPATYQPPVSQAVADSQTEIQISTPEAHFNIRRGEIVGLFGMAAGPQFDLLGRLYGIGTSGEARLRFEGRDLHLGDPRAAIAGGVYYVGADRERDGLLVEMSALDNLVLPWIHRYTRFGVYSHRLATSAYSHAESVLNLSGGHMDASVTALSGGNRQKIFLGRWLFGDAPRLLLLAQPTQGVDVGARADIAVALAALSDKGVAALVASSESDEIELLCDRALTLHGTDCIETRPGPNWSERLLESLVEAEPES